MKNIVFVSSQFRKWLIRKVKMYFKISSAWQVNTLAALRRVFAVRRKRAQIETNH